MTEDESHPRPQSRMTEERNRIKARATTTIRGCLPPVPLGASCPPGDQRTRTRVVVGWADRSRG